MASSASAALTLSDFQSITSSTVPLGCILAYNNSPLSGCSRRTDFTAGSGCSPNCVRSIRLLQASLQSVCVDADMPPNSVLGAAVGGTLVEMLCGRGSEVITSTLRGPNPPATSRRGGSPSSSTSNSSSPSSSVSRQPSNSSPPSLTPTTRSRAESTAPQPTGGNRDGDGGDGGAAGSQTTTAATQVASPGTNTAAPQAQTPRGGGRDRGGGGSPFDEVPANSGQRGFGHVRSIWTVVVWVWAMGLAGGFVLGGVRL